MIFKVCFVALVLVGSAPSIFLTPLYAEKAKCEEALKRSKRQSALEKATKTIRERMVQALNVPYSMTFARLVAGSTASKFWLYAGTEYLSLVEKIGYLMEFNSKGEELSRRSVFNYEIPLNPARKIPKLPSAAFAMFEFLGWNLASSFYLMNGGALPSRLKPSVEAVPVDVAGTVAENLFRQLEDTSPTLNLTEYNVNRSRLYLVMSYLIERTPFQSAGARRGEVQIEFEKRRGVMLVSQMGLSPNSWREPFRGMLDEPLLLSKKEFDQYLKNLIDEILLAIKSYGALIGDGSVGDPLARTYKKEMYTQDKGVRVYTLRGFREGSPAAHGRMMTLGRITIHYRTNDRGQPLYPAIEKISFWRAPSEILE